MNLPEMIRVIDGTPIPYSDGQFRMDILPAVAPPAPLPDDFLAQFDVFRPVLAPEPATDGLADAIVNDMPELIDGVWTWTWRVEDKALDYGAAKATMVAWIDGMTAQVMDQYPRAVQARWSIEEAAARAVKAGTATQEQTDLVTDEGAAKGRTPGEHADRIIANADRFRAIADQINKLFLATDAALSAARDGGNEGQYPAILRGAMAQAAPLAQAYGLSV